jgi:hypothetical protein
MNRFLIAGSGAQLSGKVTLMYGQSHPTCIAVSVGPCVMHHYATQTTRRAKIYELNFSLIIIDECHGPPRGWYVSFLARAWYVFSYGFSPAPPAVFLLGIHYLK